MIINKELSNLALTELGKALNGDFDFQTEHAQLNKMTLKQRTALCREKIQNAGLTDKTKGSVMLITSILLQQKPQGFLATIKKVLSTVFNTLFCISTRRKSDWEYLQSMYTKSITPSSRS